MTALIKLSQRVVVFLLPMVAYSMVAVGVSAGVAPKPDRPDQPRKASSQFQEKLQRVGRRECAKFCRSQTGRNPRKPIPAVPGELAVACSAMTRRWQTP